MPAVSYKHQLPKLGSPSLGFLALNPAGCNHVFEYQQALSDGFTEQGLRAYWRLRPGVNEERHVKLYRSLESLEEDLASASSSLRMTARVFHFDFRMVRLVFVRWTLRRHSLRELTQLLLGDAA